MDLYDELPHSKLLCDDEFSSLLDSSMHNQVSIVEFLTLQANELAILLQRSINEVAKFQEKLCEEFDEQFSDTKFRQIVEESDGPVHFTSGDASIDDTLGGGFFTHGITEVFGESSTGKSQLLMQLSLSVQLPFKLGGLEGKCVYIATEGDLTTQRLSELIDSRKEFKDNGVSQDNIYTVTCNDLMAQEHILDVQLPVLLERDNGSIRLLVIDSIAHHMRVELSSTSFRESQDNRFYIDRMAEKLLALANKYSMAIVVANQVSDKPLIETSEPSYQEITDFDYQLGWLVGWRDSSILYRQKFNEPYIFNKAESTKFDCRDDILSDDEDSILIENELQKSESNVGGFNEAHLAKKQHINDTSETKVGKATFLSKKVPKRKIDRRVPSLGLAWATHLSTRILLKKNYKASPLVKRGEVSLYRGSDPSAFWHVKRTMKVVFSSYAPSREISYVINKRGVEGI